MYIFLPVQIKNPARLKRRITKSKPAGNNFLINFDKHSHVKI